MSSTDPTASDLTEIRADLARAIRADHQRRTRRRRAARGTALAAIGLAALSGTALAAGQLTGVIDLGGAVTAQPVSSIPAPPAGRPTLPTGVKAPPKLPFNYEIHGLTVNGKPYQGKVYIGSSRPLSAAHRCIGVNSAKHPPHAGAADVGDGQNQQAERVHAPGGGTSPVLAPGSHAGAVVVSASGSGPGSAPVSLAGSAKSPVGANCNK